jgi:ATP-dependent RNA helicase RhlE
LISTKSEAPAIRADVAVDFEGFETLGLAPALLLAIRGMGYERPTEIQSQSIPSALAGHDVLACAMTGSGKTAAFCLPMVQRLSATKSASNRVGPRALVLAPTRELAAQVGSHLKSLAANAKITSAVIHGGVPMGPQETAFRKGVDVIVATPGRLLDHLQRSYASLGSVEMLVLDEADRMLDMGFLPDVKRILSRLSKGPRQTLLFSATLPAPIVTLASELMKAPVRIGQERKAAPAHGITQAVYPVDSKQKTDLLLELLARREIGNAIVFCRTKHRANRLALQLEKGGITTARIHGNRSQNQRTIALEGFKRGEFRVLVATDIVARGIDVIALGHVVNYDVPNAAEDYIHRIGRTARAEATGEAYTLVSPEEEQDMKDIERVLGKKIERRMVSGIVARSEPPTPRPAQRNPASSKDPRYQQKREAAPAGSRPRRRRFGGGR